VNVHTQDIIPLSDEWDGDGPSPEDAEGETFLPQHQLWMDDGRTHLTKVGRSEDRTFFTDRNLPPTLSEQSSALHFRRHPLSHAPATLEDQPCLTEEWS
jgi:hypothetical protein